MRVGGGKEEGGWNMALGGVELANWAIGYGFSGTA